VYFFTHSVEVRMCRAIGFAGEIAVARGRRRHDGAVFAGVVAGTWRANSAIAINFVNNSIFENTEGIA